MRVLKSKNITVMGKKGGVMDAAIEGIMGMIGLVIVVSAYAAIKGNLSSLEKVVMGFFGTIYSIVLLKIVMDRAKKG